MSVEYKVYYDGEILGVGTSVEEAWEEAIRNMSHILYPELDNFHLVKEQNGDERTPA